MKKSYLLWHTISRTNITAKHNDAQIRKASKCTFSAVISWDQGDEVGLNIGRNSLLQRSLLWQHAIDLGIKCGTK